MNKQITALAILSKLDNYNEIIKTAFLTNKGAGKSMVFLPKKVTKRAKIVELFL